MIQLLLVYTYILRIFKIKVYKFSIWNVLESLLSESSVSTLLLESNLFEMKVIIPRYVKCPTIR